MKNYTIEIDSENSRIVETYLQICTPEEFEAANKEARDLMFKNDIKDRVAHFQKTKGVYCTVEVSQQKSLVQDNWVGSFGTQGHFLQVVNYIKDRVKEHRLKFWLANLYEMEGVFDSSRFHLTNIIMPAVIKAGLIKEAIVFPKHFTSTMTTRDALNSIEKKDKLEIGHFTSLQDASEWLNS
jgi:hypothetical protein